MYTSVIEEAEVLIECTTFKQLYKSTLAFVRSECDLQRGEFIHALFYSGTAYNRETLLAGMTGIKTELCTTVVFDRA